MFSKTVLLLLVVYLSLGSSNGQMIERPKKFFRNDYSYIAAEESFYKIHTSPQNWTDAKRVCALEGATFWHPDNDDEAQAVISFWTTTQPDIGWVYVGLSRIMAKGLFETVDGKSISEVYNKWQSGQPDNYGGKQNCVYMYKHSGVLDDYPCDYTYNFICKKTLQSLERNYHCNTSDSDGQMIERLKKFFRNDYSYIAAEESFYKIHTSPQNWTDAKRVCALEGASFWHPDNDEEAQAVISFWTTTQPNIGWLYVGLSRITPKGLFETVDGKSISEVYNKWQSGQPDNYGGKQDCVYMYKQGILDDYPCYYTYNFICKKTLQSLERNYHSNTSDSDGQMIERLKKFFQNDYSYVAAEENFYKIHTSPQNWTDAKRVCALEGATFWHPDNEDEAQAVISFWNTTQPNIGWMYVGLHIMAKGLFETVDGKSISEVYNKWQSGQPDNNGGKQDCVYMYKQGILDDYPCDYTYNFICKKTLQSLARNCNTSDSDGQMIERPNKFFRNDYSYIAAEESFYKIHTSPQNWTDAKRVCALEGATFWHPENDDEAQAVISFWNTTQPHIGWVYVGMSDIMANGLFETVDGKSISEVYNKWQSGQPNNFGGKQICVYIYKEGILDDYPCDYKYNFICKKTLQSLEWNYHCNMSDPDYILNKDNGKCYKVHTTPLKWIEAYTTCRREQSYLAVISNKLEVDYLVNLTESTPKPRIKHDYERGIYHVGFHNRFNEGWQTVKGTPLSVYADAWWDSYKPADDRNQCGSMFYTGRLTNTDCDMKSFFICEHELANSSTEFKHF